MDPDTERAREAAASWLVLLDDDPADAGRQARFLAGGHARARGGVAERQPHRERARNGNA